MDTYWLSDSESNEKFWQHEWAAHGTCVSTLDPDCYSDYQTGQEAADFFQVVVDLFKTLDTYSVSCKCPAEGLDIWSLWSGVSRV